MVAALDAEPRAGLFERERFIRADGPLDELHGAPPAALGRGQAVARALGGQRASVEGRVVGDEQSPVDEGRERGPNLQPVGRGREILRLKAPVPGRRRQAVVDGAHQRVENDAPRRVAERDLDDLGRGAGPDRLRVDDESALVKLVGFERGRVGLPGGVKHAGILTLKDGRGRKLSEIFQKPPRRFHNCLLCVPLGGQFY